MVKGASSCPGRVLGSADKYVLSMLFSVALIFWYIFSDIPIILKGTWRMEDYNLFILAFSVTEYLACTRFSVFDTE